MVPDASPERTNGAAAFCTTHWIVVLQAVAPDSPEAHAALEKLCEAYWYPLYACVRRHGYGPDDARDLTRILRTAPFKELAPTCRPATRQVPDLSPDRIDEFPRNRMGEGKI